jgi:hypothetical protein
LLAQSGAFDSPQAAGEAVRQFKAGTFADSVRLSVPEAELRSALDALAES